MVVWDLVVSSLWSFQRCNDVIDQLNIQRILTPVCHSASQVTFVLFQGVLTQQFECVNIISNTVFGDSDSE